MYLTKIYSDMQLQWMLDMGPIDMQDFWIIQPKLLPPSLRAVLPEPLPERPSFYRSLFTVLDPHVSGETSAVYQYQYHGVAAGGLDLNFKLLRGVPDDTWVEVQRGADSVGAYVWFYYMKGSGNWLNVGKTLSFIDHANAFEWFRIATPPDDGDQKQTNLAKAALADGYDSIQFKEEYDRISEVIENSTDTAAQKKQQQEDAFRQAQESRDEAAKDVNAGDKKAADNEVPPCIRLDTTVKYVK